jgi:hypothetical protein
LIYILKENPSKTCRLPKPVIIEQPHQKYFYYFVEEYKYKNNTKFSSPSPSSWIFGGKSEKYLCLNFNRDILIHNLKKIFLTITELVNFWRQIRKVSMPQSLISPDSFLGTLL